MLFLSNHFPANLSGYVHLLLLFANSLFGCFSGYWHDEEKDSIRDEKLKSVGYKVIRIDASEVIKGLETYRNEF